MSTPPELPADELPPEPIAPDCCFSGCAQCVLDDHAEEMRRWRAECAAIIARRSNSDSAPKTPADPQPGPPGDSLN